MFILYKERKEIVMVLLEGGDKLSTIVEIALRRLRIPGSLHGMWYLTYAIRKTVEDPVYIRFVTKVVYVDVAKHYRTTPSCVERAMRHAIEVCWRNDGRNELDQMAGYHMVKRPTNSEFIDLVAFYIRHN